MARQRPSRHCLPAELITLRFTPGSRQVLSGEYMGSVPEMDEVSRTRKQTKVGLVKYVHRKERMREMRGWLERALAERLPAAWVLYWT